MTLQKFGKGKFIKTLFWVGNIWMRATATGQYYVIETMQGDSNTGINFRGFFLYPSHQLKHDSDKSQNKAANMMEYIRVFSYTYS